MVIYTKHYLLEAEEIMRIVVNDQQNEIAKKVKELTFTKALVTRLEMQNKAKVEQVIISKPLPAFSRNLLVNIEVFHSFSLTKAISKLNKADPTKDEEKATFTTSCNDFAEGIAKFFKTGKEKWKDYLMYKVGYTYENNKTHSDNLKNALIKLGAVYFATIFYCLTEVEMLDVYDTIGSNWPTGPWRILNDDVKQDLSQREKNELIRTSFLFSQVDKINKKDSLLYQQEIVNYIIRDKTKLETILKASRTYELAGAGNTFGPEDFSNYTEMVHARAIDYVIDVFNRNLTPYFQTAIEGLNSAFLSMKSALTTANHTAYDSDYIQSIISFLERRAILVPKTSDLPNIGRLKFTEVDILEKAEEPTFDNSDHVYTPLLERGSNKVPIAATIPTWNSSQNSLERHMLDTVEPLIRSELGCKQRKDLLKSIHWVLETKDQRYMLQEDCLSLLPQVSDITEIELMDHLRRVCMFFDPSHLEYTIDFRKKYESRKWRQQKQSENITLLGRRLEKQCRLGYPESHMTAVNRRQLCIYFVEALRNTTLKEWLFNNHADSISINGSLQNLIIIAQKREEMVRKIENMFPSSEPVTQKIRTLNKISESTKYWEFATLYAENALEALENYIPNSQNFYENGQYKIPQDMEDLRILQNKIYNTTYKEFLTKFPNEESPVPQNQAWRCFHWKSLTVFDHVDIGDETYYYDDYINELNESNSDTEMSTDNDSEEEIEHDEPVIEPSGNCSCNDETSREEESSEDTSENSNEPTDDEPVIEPSGNCSCYDETSHEESSEDTSEKSEENDSENEQ